MIITTTAFDFVINQLSKITENCKIAAKINSFEKFEDGKVCLKLQFYKVVLSDGVEVDQLIESRSFTFDETTIDAMSVQYGFDKDSTSFSDLYNVLLQDYNADSPFKDGLTWETR